MSDKPFAEASSPGTVTMDTFVRVETKPVKKSMMRTGLFVSNMVLFAALLHGIGIYVGQTTIEEAASNILMLFGGLCAGIIYGWHDQLKEDE